MTALAADRNTPQRQRGRRVFPVAAGVKIYAGAQVAINAAGYAVPMSVSTTLKGVGRAERRADNTNGAAGAISVEVEFGTFRYANSTSTDAITQADIGSTCYGVDDQTVAKTNGGSTRSPAGTIYDVDAQGVWVTYA